MRDLVGGAERSRAGARPSWAREFRAKEWEVTSWQRARLAIRATVKPTRRARNLKSCRTEKTRADNGPRKSPISGPNPVGQFVVFSVLQLRRIRGCREAFAAALAASRRPKNCRQRLAFRPGGTPQEISRGQARASGRRPRLPRQTGHAPAGHRRSFWWRPPRSISATTRRLGPNGQPVIGRHPGPLSSMPRWGPEPLGTVSGGGVRWRRLAPG